MDRNPPNSKEGSGEDKDGSSEVKDGSNRSISSDSFNKRLLGCSINNITTLGGGVSDSTFEAGCTLDCYWGDASTSSDVCSAQSSTGKRSLDNNGLSPRPLTRPKYGSDTPCASVVEVAAHAEVPRRLTRNERWEERFLTADEADADANADADADADPDAAAEFDAAADANANADADADPEVAAGAEVPRRLTANERWEKRFLAADDAPDDAKNAGADADGVRADLRLILNSVLDIQKAIERMAARGI